MQVSGSSVVTIDTEDVSPHMVVQTINGGPRMFTQELQIQFSNGTKVRFVVESGEELSKYLTLGCIEVACGELVFQNKALMDSHKDC